jgi:uncharacterized protein (DUF1499 family)
MRRPILLAVAVLILAGLAWIRLAPSDPGRWNRDPRLAVAGAAGFVAGPRGQIDAPAFDLPPEALLDRLAEVASGWPRTRLLVRDGLRATWITRTRVFGFPDYTTVEAVPEGGGTRLLIHARQRFGRGDHGVNAARARAWLAALGASEAK